MDLQKQLKDINEEEKLNMRKELNNLQLPELIAKLNSIL